MLQKYQNVIYTISFTDLFAIGLISPLLGNHLKSLGASHFVIGLLGSSYSGIQIISGPIIGSWSDISDRKTVLKITLLLCGTCYLSLGFLNSIGYIFLVRILLGCLKHTQGSCKAMISDLFPSEKQAEMLSRSAVLGTIGFNAGPLIGGYISEMPNGFTYICILVFLLFMCNLVLSSFLPSFTSKVTERNNDETSSIGRLKDELSKILFNIKSINWTENGYLFAIRFLFGISMAFYFYNEPFYLRESFNFSQVQLGYLMSFRGVVQTCAIFSLGHISKILYKNDSNCLRRIYHFFLLLSISIFLLYLADNFFMYLLCMLPLVIASAVLRISTMELLLASCNKDQIGTFSGVSNSIMSVARFITPVISGIISDVSSSQVAMLAYSVPAFLGTILSLRMCSKLKNIKRKSN